MEVALILSKAEMDSALSNTLLREWVLAANPELLGTSPMRFLLPVSSEFEISLAKLASDNEVAEKLYHTLKGLHIL